MLKKQTSIRGRIMRIQYNGLKAFQTRKRKLFVNFDAEDVYPSISEILLTNVITYAKSLID